MSYIIILESVFRLVDFVMEKIKEDKNLHNKSKEELIAYFEKRFTEINDNLTPLSRKEETNA